MAQNSNYPNNHNPKKIAFEADSLNSTFRWEMELTPGLPGNKVAFMDGYSKGKGNENINRLTLLYKKLVNPVLPYLSRCNSIFIYEQDNNLPKPYHPVLLKLYPHGFQALGWVREAPVIVNFLNTYYSTYVRTGSMPALEDRRKNARQQFFNPDLDHSRYTFKTREELAEFCRQRVNVYSLTCMNIWYHKHADLQPELFTTDNREAAQHVINTASTLEQAQMALQAMQNSPNYKTNR